MRRRLAPGFRIGASFQARFSDDGSLLATLGKRITLWDVALRERIAAGPPFRYASSVAFAPGGALLAAKNTLGEVVVLGVPALDERARFSGNGFGEGAGIAFSPDGQHLIDGTWSGRLTVRDALSGAVVWEEHGDSVFRLGGTRDRHLWAYDRNGQRWGRPSGVFVRRWPFADNDPDRVPGLPAAGQLALSDDGHKLAARTRGIVVLQRAHGKDTWTRTAELDDVDYGGSGSALAWNADGTHLAHAGDHRGEIYDEQLRLLRSEALPYPHDVDFSPARGLLAFGDWSAGLVVAWPAPDDQHVSP